MARLFLSPALALATSVVACATATEPGVCDGSSTAFPDGVCLDLTAAGSLIEHRSLIEVEVGHTLEVARRLIGVSDLRIEVIADASRAIPEIGMGGFNPSISVVQLFCDASRADIAAVLEKELMAQLAHELHHAMRRREVGYGSTLLEAVVSEGLADHFALEVVPAQHPLWASALEEPELARWTAEVLSRRTGSYDHPKWFYGTDPEVPRWTGYAVGFALVGAKLDRDGGLRASALVGEPAASFVPPSEQTGALLL